MAPAVERREHIRGGVSDRSLSPDMKRRGVGRRSSPRREGSPSRRRSSSPSRTRSPQRNSRRSLDKGKQRDRDGALKHAHARGRSPVRSSSSRSPSPRTKRSRKAQNERESEKVTSREERNSRGEHKKGRERELGEKVRTSPSRSPSPHTKRLLQAQSGRESEKVIRREDERNSKDELKKGSEREFREKERNSVSRSPSPRTKRLMRAQAEREVEKVKERERGSNTSKEERDNGRHGERREAENILNEKRSTRDWKQGGSSRSSKRDRDRSVSPVEHNGRSKRGSRSPSRASRPHAREEVSNPRGAEQSRDSDVDSVAKMKAAEESLEAKEKDKQKPSFELSGKLAEETNRVRGVTLLFNEPADARKPDVRWRLYVFKGGEVLNEPLYVHRQSCYLFGRERRVADIPTDHPSCSKQHAIIQYRLVEKEKPDGLMSKQVRPYIMDLGSTNGTFINDNRIEPQRYYELFEKDTIKFGNSSREYVILHENSVN